MDTEEFSPVERERANAFVKAFGKGKPLTPPPIKTPQFKKELLPKPEPKAIVVDPNVFSVEDLPKNDLPKSEPFKSELSPKVNIGAEYKAKKQEEKELKALKEKSAPGNGGALQFLTALVLLGTILLSLYNFEAVRKIKKEQARLISNQQMIFDKLARLGKGLRR